MTKDEEPNVRALVAKWLQKQKHTDTRAGTVRFAGLIGAAVRQVRHGNPPDRWARLGYRTARRKRERAALEASYGNPSAPNPRGSKA